MIQLTLKTTAILVGIITILVIMGLKACTTEPDTIKEKPLGKIIIAPNIQVAEKAVVKTIESKTPSKSKELKNAKVIRKISYKQTSKTGEKTNADVEILKRKDGQTQVAVTTDEGTDITELSDTVLEETDTKTEKKDSRRYLELRATSQNDARVVLGREAKLFGNDSINAYWGVEVSKSITDNDAQIGVKVGIEF